MGLIGASIGLRATRCGAHVTGYDPDPGAVAIAGERGAISAATESLLDLARACDVLVLAGPLDVILAQLRDLAAESGPRAILDVASVKAPVVAAGNRLPAFVATHPIAGSERGGPAFARADLFEGRTWTVDPDAAAESLALARALIEACGATVLEIDSAEHDRTIALTSHLPQVASVALGALLDERLNEPFVRELCGTGMRSMLRLGASSWPVWRDVLGANSVSVAQEVRRLAAILSDAAEALETSRVDELTARFASASAAVARLGEAVTDRKAN